MLIYRGVILCLQDKKLNSSAVGSNNGISIMCREETSVFKPLFQPYTNDATTNS